MSDEVWMLWLMVESDDCPGSHDGLLCSLFGWTESYGGVLLLMLLLLLISTIGYMTFLDYKSLKQLFILKFKFIWVTFKIKQSITLLYSCYHGIENLISSSKFNRLLWEIFSKCFARLSEVGEKDVEGKDCGLFWGTIIAFSWRTEKNLSHYGESAHWDSNLRPPKYNVGVLTTWTTWLLCCLQDIICSTENKRKFLNYFKKPDTKLARREYRAT
jgi:hypothetical protein